MTYWELVLAVAGGGIILGTWHPRGLMEIVCDISDEIDNGFLSTAFIVFMFVALNLIGLACLYRGIA